VHGRLNFKLLLEDSLMTRKHSPKFKLDLMNSSLKTITLEKEKGFELIQIGLNPIQKFL
jgi:hypothetical protein